MQVCWCPLSSSQNNQVLANLAAIVGIFAGLVTIAQAFEQPKRRRSQG
jgi:hypothetical protein